MALTVLYKGGFFDTTIPIDPDFITGDLETDIREAHIVSYKAGRLVSVTAEGYAALSDGTTGVGTDSYKGTEGVIETDAAGASIVENHPVLASGYLTVVTGPALIETDQVVETNIAPGDLLYAGTSSNIGLFTNVAPSPAYPIGIARTANSASDKTTRIRLFAV